MAYSELDPTISDFGDYGNHRDIITPGSIETDTKWEYRYPNLTFGTIADNYWGGHCQLYDRDSKFKISDLNDIKDFTLNRVGFDDYLWIKLNDQTIYVGPHGGDRVELKNNGYLTGVTTDGTNQHSCELGTNWNKDLNIDLKPYLNEGDNTLWTRTVVSGWGESWLNIKVKHQSDN